MFLDLIFLILMILAAFKGFNKGFIVALFSIFAFIAGIAAAMKLSATMAGYLGENLHIAVQWLPVVSFMVVFVLVVVLVRLGAKIIEKTIDLALLGWLNRLAGILLYALLYAIVLSILVFYASQVKIISAETLAASRTWPYIERLGPWAMESLGWLVPVFKNMFGELQAFFQGVNGKLN